ncbi:MAG: cupin domain-containing protein [Phycisphaerales bacterium]|nr:cupin domain-containing protein [Phycisphaerales bacterium]MCB9862679.1 cupin domain-containing protein [Phycisphaerales bacterium]
MQPFVVNISDKFSRFNQHWSPKIVGEVNDCAVKLVKLKGEFVWHSHEREDEMFLVIKGSLRMLLRDRELVVNEGEFVIIPRGVEHCPVADEEVHVMLFEPAGTLNTGSVTNERTVSEPERI